MNNHFFVLCKQLGDLCLKKNVRIALAESCTGGMMSSFITEVAGCSEWFLGSAVTYSNVAKKNLLQISADILEKHGAVSEAVAVQMALGALAQFESDIALSITGIAGPQGGTTQKPVGTVCFALAEHRNGFSQAKTQHFESGRDWVRRSAAGFGLKWLVEYLGDQ